MPSQNPPDEPTGSFQESGGNANTDETREATTEHARQLSLKASSLVGQQFGAYQLVAEISVGGMGAVYRAVQSEPVRRDVALKVIKSDSVTPQWTKRFEAERQAMAMLEHPCVAKIFDGGTMPNGAPFLSMELVDGQPFSDYCDTNTLNVKQRLELLLQVCSAVQHAHDRGIIHRDLKPSNVLVSEVDGKPLPKVIDFGLAKSIDAEAPIADTDLTMHGTVMGTAVYMSPEQASGESLDGRTDVYSLGVMLYETLVGSTPLEASSLHGLQPLQRLERICQHVAPKPSVRLRQSHDTIATVAQQRSTSSTHLRSMLSGELDWVVLQAIDKEAARRYETVQDFANDIERYLNHEPVYAKPPSLAYRGRKFVQRNRMQVALASTGLVAVAILGVLLPAIFTYRNNAQLARYEAALLTHPSEFELTSEEFHQQAQLVRLLSRLDPTRSEIARAELAANLVNALTTAVERPRLTGEERSNYESLLAVLTKSPLLQPNLAALHTIGSRLQELQGNWLQVFASDAGQPKTLAQAFGAGSVRLVSGGLQMTAQPDSAVALNQADFSLPSTWDFAIPLTETNLRCTGDTRVEATFAQPITEGEIAVCLDVVDGSGYEFVVRTALPELSLNGYTATADAAMGTPQEEQEQGRLLLAEIRRGNATLLRTELQPNLLTEASIRITATRERNLLSIQVNSMPVQSIFDPFPLTTNQEGSVGIRSMPSTTLVALRSESKEAADLASALARGDAAFSAGEYDIALQAYQRERDDAVATETDYKAAICLQRLGRNTEALPLLQKAEASEVYPWSTLAAIGIWEVSLSNPDIASQKAAYNRLLASQTAANVASLLPEDTRLRIVQSQLKTYSMGDLLQADPNRLEKVTFAAEIDRTLSFDGRGSLAGQAQYARVLRYEGHLEEAAQILEQLNAQYEHHHLVAVYARLLRALGRPEDAYRFVLGKEKQQTAESPYWLYQRALCEFAMGRESLGDLSLQAAVQKDANDPSFQASLSLIQGFRQLQSGSAADAKETWRHGYREFRKTMKTIASSHHASLITMLVLGSLSGDLLQADSDAFVNLLLADSYGIELKPLLSMALPPAKLHQIFLSMWNSDLGMEVAEDLAFERLSFRERTIGPAHVATYQMLISGAFAESIDPADREIAVECARGIVRAKLESNGLELPQLFGLYSAWSGSRSLPGSLTGDYVSHLHYCLAQRLLRNASKDAAVEQFRQAFEKSSAKDNVPQNRVHARAAEMLELLEGDLGLLVIECAPELYDSTEIIDSNQQVVDFPTDQRFDRRRLSPGTYVVHNDAESWRAAVEVKLGQTAFVSIPWKWTPSERAGRIAGLLSHPAKLDGIDDWQLVEDTMEASCHGFAWSPDGTRIAIVGDEYIRIANADTGLYETAIAVTGAQLRNVDWSSQDRLAVGTRSGQVFLVDPLTRESVETKLRYPQRVSSLRWNPDGSLLAVGGESNTAHIYDTAGELVESIVGMTGDWMGVVRWSPSGAYLAVIGAHEVKVFNTSGWNRVLRFADLQIGWDVLWFADEEQFVVTDNHHLRTISMRNSAVLQQQDVYVASGQGSIIWGPDEHSIYGIDRGSAGMLIWNRRANAGEALQKKAVFGYGPLRISPDGSRVATGNLNGVVISDRNMENPLTIGRHPAVELSQVSYSRSRDVVATLGRYKPTLKVMSFVDGKTRVFAEADRFQSCAWSRDGAVLAAGSKDGRVLLFDEAGHVLSERTIADKPVSNLRWTRDGAKLVAGTAAGELFLLTMQRNSPTATIESLELLRAGDENLTDWQGSQLALAPDSDDGAYFRNGQLARFTLTPNYTESLLSSLSPTPYRDLCFLTGGRLIAKLHRGYEIATGVSGWQVEDHALPQSPTCFCEFSPRLVLVGTEDGVINQLNLSTRELSFICETGSELLSLQPVSDDAVLAVNLYGSMRKIDIRTGNVIQLAVVTQNDDLACITGGGKVLSSPASLEGFSCIISRAGVLESTPAVELLK